MEYKISAIRKYKHKHEHGKAGFTLLEVLIVMVVIGLLAAIAIPSYTKHIKKSKQVEAKTNLSSIALLLEEYKSLYGRYCPDCLKPLDEKTFEYKEDNDGKPTTDTITDWLDVKPKQAASGAAVCYDYKIIASIDKLGQHEFELTATPIVSRGVLADNLTIDQDGAKGKGSVSGW